MSLNSEVWGSYGKLAIAWSNSFLPDNDQLVLVQFLNKKSLVVDVENQLWVTVQQYLTKEEMNHSLQNLCNSGILRAQKIQVDKKNEKYEYIYNHQQRNFASATLNNQIFIHLRRLLEDQIVPFRDKEDNERKKQQSQYGLKSCVSCGATYSIADMHLKGIRECQRPQCRVKTLKNKVEDTRLEDKLLGFGHAIESIRKFLEKCEEEDFPTEEHFKSWFSVGKMEIESAEESLYDLMGKNQKEREIRDFLLSKRKSYFDNTLNKQIDQYVNRKAQLIKQNLQLQQGIWK